QCRCAGRPARGADSWRVPLQTTAEGVSYAGCRWFTVELMPPLRRRSVAMHISASELDRLVSDPRIYESDSCVPPRAVLCGHFCVRPHVRPSGIRCHFYLEK